MNREGVVGAYIAGWLAIIHLPGTALLKWFLSLLFAIGVGFAFALPMYENFGHSIVGQDLLDGIAGDTIVEFLLDYNAELRIAAAAAIPIIILHIALGVFLTGGILHVLKEGYRHPWADFFRACGRHFVPLLIVGLMALLLFGLVVVLPHKGMEKLYDYLTVDFTSTAPSFYLTWIWWAVLFFLASWVARVYDYARILLFDVPERNPFSAFLGAILFTLRKGIKTFILWFALMLTPVAMVAALWPLQGMASSLDTLVGMGIVFGIGQLAVLFQIVAAFARLGAQMQFIEYRGEGN